MTAQIRCGLDPAQKPAATRLYWQAFAPKLGRVLGPEARALAYLDRVVRCDHAIVAETGDGRLLGVAGFQTRHGAFAAGSRADLMAVYGLVGGFWRAVLLRLLIRETENRRFLVDGLCVQPEARGRGVGTALLAALRAEARARGHDEVRLDVADANPRARALYERQGFVAVGTDRTGVLAPVFGFSTSTRMVCKAG